MIDTMGFKVIIDRETYDKILEKTRVTQRIDKETGEVEFEYDNGQTKHSYNYRVIYKVCDEYWVYDQETRQPYKKAGIPNIRIEFSVPKILFGHNLLSAGMGLIYDAMYEVRLTFQEKYCCILPDMPEWYCYRIDTSVNYILESEKQVRNFISYLSKLDYPRRRPNRYDDTGIYFPSPHSTLKVYAKGPEFKKHDMDRLRDAENIAELYARGKQILRFEVEHKKRIRYLTQQHNGQFESIAEDKSFQMEWDYLEHGLNRLEESSLQPEADHKEICKHIEATKKKIQKLNDRVVMLQGLESPEEEKITTFEGYPRIGDLIAIFDCKAEMNAVMSKLLSGTESIITDSLSAENKLRGAYSNKQASTYIAVYYSIITQGQEHGRKVFDRNTYYRSLRAFREQGIPLIVGEPSMNGENDFGIPADFCLNMDISNRYYQIPLERMPF